MFRAIQSYYQRKQYEQDIPEILELRMQLASTDKDTRKKAYALLHGIKWGTLAQIEVDQYLFEFRQKINSDELIEIQHIQSNIPMGNPRPSAKEAKKALLFWIVIITLVVIANYVET